MRPHLRENIETKLEKIISLAKNQDATLVRRGDVSNDVRETFKRQIKLAEEVKDLILIS